MTSHKNANKRDLLLISTPQSGKTGLFFFFVSLVVHGLFFAGLLFIQDFKLPKSMPQVIQIDLVSFSPQPVLDGAPTDESPLEEPPLVDVKTKNEGVPVKPAVIKKKKIKTKHIKPDISLKTKPKNLKKLMEKKKKDPIKKKEKPKVIEKKPVPEKLAPKKKDELENRIEDEDRQRISDALSRLQKKVKEQGMNKEKAGKKVSAGSGKRGSKPIDLYKMIIGSTIEQNWAFNDILASMDQNLEVGILIKILNSGEIRDIIYMTKSGNRYLDESAKKAIKKSNPLPALPAAMPSFDVIVIFTPKGLK
ncbi:MAG: TonB family protein [Desulfobacula sp.]|nr:TonB family protein [Desulfobacula sp.]